MTAKGHTVALETTSGPRTRLVEARNRLGQAIARADMSGMTRDEIVDVTGRTTRAARC
jgi:hypothetical protein